MKKIFYSLYTFFHHKKTGVIFFLLFCGLTATVSAHPPSELTVEYNTDANILTVTLTHSVSDPALHFIYRIDVFQNGTHLFSEEYYNQPSDSTFSYTYPLDAQIGETLSVFAECNLGGSLTESIIVGEGTSTRAPPNLWPFHAVFMTSGLLLMAVALFNILQKSPPKTWLTAHKASGTLSILLVGIGLIIGLYMVSQSEGGHFRVIHAYIGLLTLALSFLTPILGFYALKNRRTVLSLRPLHIWIGRIAFLLIVVTIISGLYQAGIL